MWDRNTVITKGFKGPTSIVMSVKRAAKTCIPNFERRFSVPLFIINRHYKYSISCQILTKQPASFTYVKFSCHHVHPHVLLLKTGITEAMQTFLSLWGIESLGLHPVLAAVKIEVPLLHSSGTLPSGGKSSGTGGDRLAHASWPVSFRLCVWIKGGRWKERGPGEGMMGIGRIFMHCLFCVCVYLWERERKRDGRTEDDERETEQDGTADGDGMWQFSLGLCD